MWKQGRAITSLCSSSWKPNRTSLFLLVLVSPSLFSSLQWWRPHWNCVCVTRWRPTCSLKRWRRLLWGSSIPTAACLKACAPSTQSTACWGCGEGSAERRQGSQWVPRPSCHLSLHPRNLSSSARCELNGGILGGFGFWFWFKLKRLLFLFTFL